MDPMLEAIADRIIDVIGAPRYAILESFCRNKEEILKAGGLMLMHLQKNNDVPLAENIYINAIKMISHEVPRGDQELREKAYEILTALDIPEVQYKFVYRCLFEKDGLSGNYIRIFRYTLT